MPSLTALRCVACGSSGLVASPDMLDCPGCHRAYPIVADVPVMFSDAALARGRLLTQGVARTVLRAMDLPADLGSTLRVRRVSSAGACYGDALVAAESAQFLRRVHASGYPIPDEFLAPPEPAEPPEPGAQPRCVWLVDYIPRAMRPGEACLANVRFENAGAGPMRHEGQGRVGIAFAWAGPAGEDVPVEDYRTPLPVDLPPGRAMTLPVRLVAPAEPGRYTLTLRMVMEGVRWLEPQLGPLQIAVRPDAGFVPPPHWDVNANTPRDYLTDQARGIALLRDWLKPLERSPGGSPGLRLLELGGNAKPVAAHLHAQSYNVDVDLLGLQIGALVQETRMAQRARYQAAHPGCEPAVSEPARHRVEFVCADARNLPFPEGFFDAIVMFATLHHLPDPAALLRRLKLHLRPGGFIGLFCEPIGHVWPGAVSEAFTSELRHGVNEQGFSLAEYAQMFAGAGLHAADLAADHNSLKARLVPARAEGPVVRPGGPPVGPHE